MSALFQFIFSFLTGSIVPLLASLIGGTVVQGALSIGMGVITFHGLSILFEKAMSEMMNYFGGLPSDLIQIMGLCGVDTALNIVFSAGAVLLTIKGMTKAGSLSRQSWKKTGSE